MPHISPARATCILITHDARVRRVWFNFSILDLFILVKGIIGGHNIKIVVMFHALEFYMYLYLFKTLRDKMQLRYGAHQQ